MTNHAQVKLFESVQVRSHWNEAQEKWYFSVVDVVQVLTESARPRKYWSDLKVKLQKEGSEVSEKIGQLKMQSPDGKARKTLAADVPTPLTPDPVHPITQG
jgi:hypothetical protein